MKLKMNVKVTFKNIRKVDKNNILITKDFSLFYSQSSLQLRNLLKGGEFHG